MSTFKTSSSILQALYEKNPAKVEEFIHLLNGNTTVYIDYANIRPWSDKLGWHMDVKRLKQLFNAIPIINTVKIYYGTLDGDSKSERLIQQLRDLNYEVTTKPVKLMQLSIDTSSISENSPDLLRNFVRKPLLDLCSPEEIQYLNGILRRLNASGRRRIEERKCNFDVEIGRDMLVDFNSHHLGTFILCSGDSDFEEPVKQLLHGGKKVVLLATARRIARELNALKAEGLIIFELNKLKNFICWSREIER